MSARATALIGLAGFGTAALLGLTSAYTPATATLYMHIKNDDTNTLGKVSQIYSAISATNKSGRAIGLEPQSTTDWATQIQYYRECGNIPVMLNVLTSDESKMLTINQITQAMAVCNVQCFRFHEVLSYYHPFPTSYVLSVLAFALAHEIPVFWNEWDTTTYDTLASIIQGYEGIVMVSYGTNGGYEPFDGFQLLQRFQRRAASVQSWYWWERNGRVTGSELDMPPELMVQHTNEAFQSGCEIVQYEPFSYFFTNTTPRSTLSSVLSNL